MFEPAGGQPQKSEFVLPPRVIPSFDLLPGTVHLINLEGGVGAVPSDCFATANLRRS
jgi:hypothetical protein